MLSILSKLFKFGIKIDLKLETLLFLPHNLWGPTPSTLPVVGVDNCIQ